MKNNVVDTNQSRYHPTTSIDQTKYSTSNLYSESPTDHVEQQSSDSCKIQIHNNTFLSTSNRHFVNQPKIHLIILNTRIHHESTIFRSLFNQASTIACADGGLKRLLQVEWFKNDKTLHTHVICGDLDSIRDDSSDWLDLCKERTESILHWENQNLHDLEKVLRYLEGKADWDEIEILNRNEDLKKKRIHNSEDIVIIYGSGGRLDHEMANLNVLYQRSTKLGSDCPRYIIIGEENLLEILSPNQIHVIQPNTEFENATCALIPLGGSEKKIKTCGLLWNLDHDAPLQWGGLLSTSNSWSNEKDPEIVVENDDTPLLWISILKK